MDVVGHQHIGVNIAFMLLGRVGEAFKVKMVIVIGDEKDAAVIAALNDVLRLAGRT